MSCNLHILVHEAAEQGSSQRSAPAPKRGGVPPAGGSMCGAIGATVRVVMLDVLEQHYVEMAWSGDQEAVEAFAAQRADEAFAIAIARGVPGLECGG